MLDAKARPPGRPVPLVRRLGARVVDFGVWVAVLYALDRAVPDLTVLAQLVWSVCWLVLPYWRGGRTVGKILFRIRLVRSDGSPLTLGRAFLRELFVVGSFAIPIIGVLNALAAFNDPRRQALHDKVIDTMAI